MASDRRQNDRVAFERGFPASISSLDGKWRAPCAMDDVSDEGARLTVKGSVEGADLREFILLLSANGKAYRRCELSWIKGSELGVRFIKPDGKRRRPASDSTRDRAGSVPAPADEVATEDGPVVEV